MKVLVLNNGLNRVCGVSGTIRSLVKHLGGRVEFIVGAPPGGTLFDEIRRLGARTVPLPVDSEKKSPLAFAEAVSALSRICREERIDLVHSNHRWTSLLARFPTQSLGLPLLGTAHSMHIGGFKSFSFVEDRLIAVSRAMKVFLREKFGVPAEKITVIRNGVEALEKPAPSRLARIFPPPGPGRSAQKGREPLIGAIGRLSEEKGHAFLLKAAAELHRSGRRFRLVIAGEGPEREGLEKLSERLGLEKVCFLGAVDDAPAFLAGLDVLTLPSLSEGLPLTLLEGGSLGLAVAASRVGGTPEIIDDEKNGLLVPPADPAALAGALSRLLDDPRKRRKMGEALRARVLEGFSASLQAERTYGIYRELARYDNLSIY